MATYTDDKNMSDDLSESLDDGKQVIDDGKKIKDDIDKARDGINKVRDFINDHKNKSDDKNDASSDSNSASENTDKSSDQSGQSNNPQNSDNPYDNTHISRPDSNINTPGSSNSANASNAAGNAGAESGAGSAGASGTAGNSAEGAVASTNTAGAAGTAEGAEGVAVASGATAEGAAGVAAEGAVAEGAAGAAAAEGAGTAAASSAAASGGAAAGGSAAAAGGAAAGGAVLIIPILCVIGAIMTFLMIAFIVFMMTTLKDGNAKKILNDRIYETTKEKMGFGIRIVNVADVIPPKDGSVVSYASYAIRTITGAKASIAATVVYSFGYNIYDDGGDVIDKIQGDYIPDGIKADDAWAYDCQMLVYKGIIDDVLENAYKHATGKSLTGFFKGIFQGNPYDKFVKDNGYKKSIYANGTRYKTKLVDKYGQPLTNWDQLYGDVNYGDFITTVEIATFGWKYDEYVGSDLIGKKFIKVFKGLDDKAENLSKLYAFKVVSTQDVYHYPKDPNKDPIYKGTVATITIVPYTIEGLYDLCGSSIDSYYDDESQHVKNEDGTYADYEVLDENGNPIKEPKRKENGDIETDNNGNIIYTNEIKMHKDYGYSGEPITNEEMRAQRMNFLKAIIHNTADADGDGETTKEEKKKYLFNDKTVYEALGLDYPTTMLISDINNNTYYSGLGTGAFGNALRNISVGLLDVGDDWYLDADPSIYNGSGRLAGTICSNKIQYYDGPTQTATASSYVIDVEKVMKDTYGQFSSITGEMYDPYTANARWLAFEAESVGVYNTNKNIAGVRKRIQQSGKEIIEDNKKVKIGDAYAVAVGPGVVCRDYYQTTGGTQNLASLYGGYNGTLKMDLVLEDKSTHELKYIKITPADSKGHTYPFGIYQTNIMIPNTETEEIYTWSWNYSDWKGCLSGETASNVVNVINTSNEMIKEDCSLNLRYALDNGLIEWICMEGCYGELTRNYKCKQIIVYNPQASSQLRHTTMKVNSFSGNGSEAQNEVVQYALSKIGNQYHWGGTDIDYTGDYILTYEGQKGGKTCKYGADCSGFVWRVYKDLGYDRDMGSDKLSSLGLRDVGRAVNVSELQPGDIICTEGHVGIYIGNEEPFTITDTRGNEVTIPAKNSAGLGKIIMVAAKGGTSGYSAGSALDGSSSYGISYQSVYISSIKACRRICD